MTTELLLMCFIEHTWSQDAFSPKRLPDFGYFCFSGFGFINFDRKRSKFKNLIKMAKKKKKKMFFWFRAHFPMKIFKKIKFQQYLCATFALPIT